MRWNKKKGHISFIVKVTPKSSKNECLGWKNDQLIIKLKALPEKNKANDELIRFLSKMLKIAKSDIAIISGHTSRIKTVCIQKEKLSHSLFE